MSFSRMAIEEWFDTYQHEVDFDIGESGVKYQTLGDLDISLGEIPLRYGHHRGAPELRETILREYEDLSIDNVAVTTGASEAIFAVVASLVGRGEQMIVESPNYPSLYEIPVSLERDVKLFQIDHEFRFKPDLDRLEAMIEPHTRVIALTHPNNPTGSILESKSLERLIHMVEKKGIYLLLDETYQQLVSGDPLPPAASLSPHAISITSMSKAYGVPGIRIGWVVAKEDVIESVRAVREQVTICNSALGEYIALTVLARKQAYLKNIKKEVTKNLELLTSWMKKRSDLEWIPPEGGVVAFPRLAKEDSADALCKKLVEKYRTFTVPGSCFGMPRHFRLGYGGEYEELKKGLEMLDRALKEDH